MNFTYKIVKEYYSYEGGERVSYGIVVYSGSEVDCDSCIVATVHDITIDFKRLLELVDMCNQHQLSIIHLSDVIEDFLYY